MSTPQRIAEQLTENELLYLYIAHEIWAMSEIWDEAEISDIEDTGGTFDPAKNTLVLDYEDVMPFDRFDFPQASSVRERLGKSLWFV